MSKQPYRLVEQEVEQLEEDIRSHRRKILMVIILIIVFLLIIAGCFYYIYETKEYTGYEVLESTEREDSGSTKFAEFNGNIIKYSNDGAFCIDSKNHLIWNQTYEMQSPVLDICGDYAVIAEKQGKKIYIMDTKGPCGEVETNRPIQQVHAAGQGMVAVLMEENGIGYIQLYDKKGSFLAEGELHARNSGYPLDIAVSDDGKKLVVSMLDVNEGDIKTTVAFYNFGSVGQNEIDNMVSSYPYQGIVIPKVEFLTNDIAVAVGENRLLLYEGSQKPTVKKEIEINREIRSVFYNESYVGLVFDNENEDQSYCVEIYDTEGEPVRTFDFSMEYEEIGFLSNDEICIRGSQECSIYTLRGVRRFHCNFENEIYKIIHTGGRRYIFLMSGATEKVELQ